MARYSKDRCRFCGDIATTDADTWEPTGLCAAHAAPAVKTARKARRAVRRADRDVVVTVAPITCPTCSGPLTVSHASPETAARRGYQCDPCADQAEGLTRPY